MNIVMEPEESSQPYFHLSSSVESAIKRIDPEEKILSWTIVKQLLHKHREYGKGLGGKVADSPGPVQGERNTTKEWLEKLFQLFDPSKVTEIHGRIAILGLSKLDDQLHAFLLQNGLFNAISDELKEKTFSNLLRNAVSPSPSFTQAMAGFRSDMPDKESPDLLDVEQEALNIAYVFTSKLVNPPLALGLFGDWGSGKSFFMGKLQKYVEAISSGYRQEEKETGNVSQDGCSRVIQIEFNAWNYSDANLWASLVTGIYEKLFKELGSEEKSDKEVLEELKARVREAEGTVGAAEAHLSSAKQQVAAATNALHSAQEELRTKEKSFKGLINNLNTLFKDEKDNPLKDLDQAANMLGYPEAAKSYEALKVLNNDLSTVSRRSQALFFHLISSPWTIGLLVVLILLLPVGVNFLLENYADALSAIGKKIATGSSFLLGLVTWLQLRVKKGIDVLNTVSKAFERAEEVRDDTINKEEIKKAQLDLASAQSRETAASENLRQAQLHYQQMESELNEFQPERKLFRLIEERSKTEAFSKHLGIISLIRKDFDAISTLLKGMAEKKERAKDQSPPIQRIILYIDDLDRCRPDRVVEVLEAVHLLLAIPLFMVVVGVDPRWLRHSLAQHYPETLSDGNRPMLFNGRSSPSFHATPQDFLEKIFQIPFALRPVDQRGFSNLVRDLLKPLSPATMQEKNAIGKENSPDEKEVNEVTGGEYISPQLPLLSKDQLQFQSWEQKDIELLWPLFQTPRTIKRFINIYRILRAGLRSESEIKAFEGYESSPGEYQVAILLLAIVTNFPNAADLLLLQSLTWLDNTQTDPSANQLNWNMVIEGLQTLPDDLKEDVNGEMASEWTIMLTDLKAICLKNDFQPFTSEVFKKWLLHVSRYSFAVRPPQENSVYH